ncbi:MAG: AAA family ATPase [Vicinamibacterales bacterium]
MPGSSDYEYKGDDAKKQLGDALRAAGLSFAVVLKHQEFPAKQELADLQSHCSDTRLIPGAEINVFVDALGKKVNKDYFFHCIVAVDPSTGGDYGYVLQKAKEQFAYKGAEYPSGFHSSILDLGRFFRTHGALFIPAHLHQSKAPETSRSIDDVYDDDAFLGFVGDGAFDALEVRQRATATFFDGTRQTPAGAAIPASVCVMSSDAHHHDHVVQRQRWTWVRTETTAFADLAAALSFRHRVTLEQPTVTHARVLGMHVVGAFIPEAWVSLNDGLNALIGSKGSGKTALLECLRFVLNTPVPQERRESVDRHLTHVLGTGGYVECLVVGADGRRTLITRRADAKDRITILDEGGNTQQLSSASDMPFPISILGWHEIEAVADKADARVGLLDRIGDAVAIRSLYGEIRAQVEWARDQLPGFQRQIKKLDKAIKDLWDLQSKRATLAKLEEGELLALQRQYEWFLASEQTLQSLAAEAQERSDRLPSGLSANVALGLAPSPTETVAMAGARAAIKKVEDSVLAHNGAESSALAALQGSLDDVKTVATGAVVALVDAFAQFREVIYTPRVNALQPDEREILSKQIQVLEETKRLPVVERQCDDLLAKVKGTASELRAACDRIGELRDQIVALREALAAQLNEALGGGVRLKVLRSANRDARTRFQDRYGEEGASLIGYVQRFGGTESYESLSALFARLAALERDQDKWDIANTLWDGRLVDLFDVLDDDDVEIALADGKAGNKPIQNLSAGQRSVAVFPLLLRNSRGPLVIDQPEDNLDNRYIADFIAPDLLQRKRQQQYLVTSHNANLVVLTDADLIVHVDADGMRSSIPAAGFLSCATSGVKDAVLDVLDGGDVALSARQRKYGTGK